MNPRSDRGSAFVELAIVTPILLVLCFGLADFARAYYMAMQLSNMARAGAQAAARSLAAAEDPAAVQAVAEAASSITGATATATRYCHCVPGFTTMSGATCLAAPPCTGGGAGHLLVYVEVQVTKTFTTVTRLPGVPNTLNLSRKALMYVPN